MEHHSFEIIQSLILLAFISSIVAMLLHKRDLPYTTVLVIVGLVLGIFHLGDEIHFTPDLVLLVFLPALLFEAAWNVHLKELRENALPITVLAVGGVLISTFVVAGLMTVSGALPWGLALLFGAMISATDPVSVIATFRQLGLSPRLATIIEGESLFNDGTAVVIFKLISGIVLASAAHGASQAGFSLPGALGSFLYTVLVGIVAGVAVGWVISRMIITIDNHLVEITLTTVAAYGTFLLAERFHASGIIAVVFATLVIGNYGRPVGMSERTQVAVDYFWEYAAFLANSLLFILVGAQIHPEEFVGVLGAVGIAIVAVLLGRAVAIFPLVGLTNLVTEKIKPVWQAVLVWGGMRGALSMALVLSLPLDTPQRAVLIKLVFGVVLFSLLAQGITMGPWLKKLKENPEHELSGPPLDDVEIRTAEARH